MRKRKSDMAARKLYSGIGVFVVLVAVIYFGLYVSAAPPSISGHVTRFNGDAIGNISVALYNITGELVATNRTGADGFYLFDLSYGGDFYLIFNGSKNGNDVYIYGAENYRNVSVTVGAGENKVLDTSMYLKTYGSYNITVRDVWNGRPVPNANVTIYYSDSMSARGTTGSDGTVLIAVPANSTLNAGVYHDIHAVGAGYVDNAWVYDSSILEGMNVQMTLNLTGSCEVHGRVDDAAVNLVTPMVEGAYVELWDYLDNGRAGWNNTYYYSAYTDANGYYVINYPTTLSSTPNCNAYLHANATGFDSQSLLIESTTVKNFSMTGSAHVSGHVADISNLTQPIDGALVALFNNGSVIYYQYTDSDGNFNISVKDGLNHTIEVDVDYYYKYSNVSVFGSSVDYGAILLRGRGMLNGTLVDASNTSIAIVGATVRIVGTDAVYTTSTDSLGAFGLPVMDYQTYYLGFEADGYTSNSSSVYVTGAEDIGDFALVGKTYLHGYVMDSLNLNDTTIADVNVIISSNVDSRMYTVVTSDDGFYSLQIPSIVNDYTIVFDKLGYNVSQGRYYYEIDAEIPDVELRGATHVGGVVYDAYSSVDWMLEGAVIDVIDDYGNVHYTTTSNSQGRYSLDLGVDFNYSVVISLDGYQEGRIFSLPWDENRNGAGGSDRVEDVGMNGSVTIDVTLVDDFDNMTIDNAQICVLYAGQTGCNVSKYVKNTGLFGNSKFNIRGGAGYQNYRLKLSRDGYFDRFYPNNDYMSGSFTGIIRLFAYAEVYVYDRYAVSNEEVYDALVEIYTYNNQTDYTLYLNETMVNVTALCNNEQADGLNVTLSSNETGYYSSLLTYGGRRTVSFRIVPLADDYILSIDGESLGCGSYNRTLSVSTGGITYLLTETTDNIPPVVENVSKSSDPLEIGDAFTLDIDADDLITAIKYVYIEIEGTNYSMEDIVGNTYRYVWGPTRLGANQFIVWAEDIRGNINRTVVSLTVQDTVSPTVVLGAPDRDLFYTSSIDFLFRPTDLSDFSNCALWTNMTGAWAQNRTNTSVILNGSWNTITLDDVTDGFFRWNVRCVDRGGNFDFADEDHYVRVDASVPTITVVEPTSGVYNTNVIPFEISSSKNLVVANYSVNGGNNITMTRVTDKNFYDALWLNDGSYVVNFFGLGTNFKWGVSSVSFTVDNGAPSTMDVVPSPSQRYYEEALVDFIITADEAVNLSVMYWNSTNSWSAVDASYNAVASANSVGLLAGTYSWNYTICDDAGNCASSSTRMFEVVLDTIPPTSSRVNSSQVSIAAGGSVVLSAFWTDNETLLSMAILETNETGEWRNKTAYGSPMTLSGSAAWSNFTWSNASVAAGTSIGWRIWAKDSKNNFGVTSINRFNILPVTSTSGSSLTVYVDDALDVAVLPDGSGLGANVTVYNSTYYASLNTSDVGYAVFEGLCTGCVYNVSVNASMQGYGSNETADYMVIGDSNTHIIVNMTRLIVNVTDASFNPVSGANVTVYEADDATVATNASGGNLLGVSDGTGIVIFNRVLPCVGCNVSVSKDIGTVVFNSSNADIFAGNSSNYAWVDPPQSLADTFNLNFTIMSYITPANVTFNVREYNTGIVIASNTTDSNGRTMIYDLPSGIYDFEIDGEDKGYGKVTYRRNVVGVYILTEARTGVDGKAEIKLNGLLTYYVSVNAKGYRDYDDLNVSMPRVGSYDDNVSASGIDPKIIIALTGNTTLEGHVYDRNFYQPELLSYEPVSDAVLSVYTQALCDPVPPFANMRYRAVAGSNGSYSIRVSPTQKDDPDASQDYCLYVEADGFDDKNLNDVNVNNAVNPGLDGEGLVSGYVLSSATSNPVYDSEVLLRSFECYDGPSGPLSNCGAYRVLTDSNGYFRLAVNSRSTGFSPQYMPYTMRIKKNGGGYFIKDDVTITGLPSSGVTYYLVPSSLAALVVSAESEDGIMISDDVTLSITGNGQVYNNSFCEYGAGQYTCNLAVGEYDVVVNGSAAGYGVYAENDVFVSSAVTRNVTLGVTTANITIFNEIGGYLSGLNVTIGELTNTTVNGSAVFYRVPVGSYVIGVDGMPEYMGLVNGTIDITNLGGMNSKSIYANVTEFYVNISNGTAGVANLSVNINGLANYTNATGEIMFSRVDRSYTGYDYVPVVFNRSDVYVNGYFAPNLSVVVAPGLDSDSGNSFEVVLNSTAGYGIFAVRSNVALANISLYYNGTEYVMSDVTGDDGYSFVYVNVSEHNSSIYITAQKSGYGDAIYGPYNTSSMNVSFVDVTLVPDGPYCGDGSCNGVESCSSCSADCGICSIPSGGGGGSSTSSSGGSSGGGSVVIPSVTDDDEIDVEVDNDIYGLALSVDDGYTINVADGDLCVDVSLDMFNIRSGALSGLAASVVENNVFDVVDFDGDAGDLAGYESRSLLLSLCVGDASSLRSGKYYVVISVSNENVKQSAKVNVNIINPASDEVAELGDMLDRLNSLLFGIDTSLLDTEMMELYDSAKMDLVRADEYIDSGDMDNARYYLGEAEGKIGTILQWIEKNGSADDGGMNMLFVAGGVSIIALAGLLLYLFVIRKKPEENQDVSFLKPLNLPSVSLSVPKVDLSKLKGPVIDMHKRLYRLLGMNDVYYARELSKNRYLTDVIERVLELKCPKCGGRIYQNRCIWCGHKVNSIARNVANVVDRRKNNGVSRGAESSKSGWDSQAKAYKFSKDDAYYTHKSKRVGGVPGRYVADAIEHVEEGKCSRCGGKIFNGRCVWCGN